MLNPTIVTHKRPHLDEVCAIWLMQKYWPQFAHADVVFVATGPTGGEVWNNIPPDSDRFVVYVGVGQGRFDEHKGDATESACSLVWAETQKLVKIPKGQRAAVERIVEHVKKEDLGAFIIGPHQEFSLATVLSGLYGINGRDSAPVYEVGRQIMEALLFEMLKVVSAEKDWEGRREVDTPWGRAAALVSDIPGVERLAYAAGFVLLISHNTARTYHGFRANPQSKVDLTEAALKVKQREPAAPWFLHQSKKMLLCGGDIAEAGRYSSLSLDEMIELVRV